MDRHEFMRACAAGGATYREAFDRLVRAQATRLAAHARKLVRGAADAQDVVQTTWLKAWSRCSTFQGDAELFTWLVSILRNTVLDAAAARAPRQVPWTDADGNPTDEVEAALRELSAHPLQPEQIAAQRECMRLFDAGFARFEALHPHEAAVLRLAAVDDMSAADLSALLGRTPGATREYVSQCRKKLRPHLAAWLDAVAERTRRPAAECP